MEISVLFFGISTDYAGTHSAQLELNDFSTIKELKETLFEKYPKLKSLQSFAVAVNENYSEDIQEIADGDTVAILPPVSGG